MEYVIYIVVFAVLLVAELAYFRIADKYNIIDKPNERSSHTKITLRGGGIIFPFSILAYFVTTGNYPWFVMGLVVISIVSFIGAFGGSIVIVLSSGVVCLPLGMGCGGVCIGYRYYKCL